MTTETASTQERALIGSTKAIFHAIILLEARGTIMGSMEAERKEAVMILNRAANGVYPQ